MPPARPAGQAGARPARVRRGARSPPVDAPARVIAAAAPGGAPEARRPARIPPFRLTGPTRPGRLRPADPSGLILGPARAVAHPTPTEPLRIPPARGPGRGLLLVLFVLLTLAAVALGVLLLRGGLSDLTGDTSDAAAASPVTVCPVRR